MIFLLNTTFLLFLHDVIYPYIETSYIILQPYFIFFFRYIYQLLLPYYTLFVQFYHPLLETLLQITHTLYQTYMMILYTHLFFTIIYALLFRKRFINSFYIILPFISILLLALYFYPLYPYFSFYIVLLFVFYLFVCQYIFQFLIYIIYILFPFTLVRKQNNSRTNIRL